MILLSKGIGVQEVYKGMDMLIRTIQIRENAKGQILLRLFTRKLRKLSTSNCTSVRKVARMTQKVSESDYSL